MGQRLAPILAICFMSRIEEPVMARLPLMSCRYIDDCFIVTSTLSEMDECFRMMNEPSPYIRLTREVPQDGWLPYLNTQISVSSGIVHVKWYRKRISKKILIHATSAHPSAIKCAVIRNMYRTATRMCSGITKREESSRLASGITRSNGYIRYHIITLEDSTLTRETLCAKTNYLYVHRSSLTRYLLQYNGVLFEHN
uniref:Reverse transcriptase domain-containing protein n=1 Tax=Haemonchus contortus TaxID=6289 RepID=A0A7I4YFU5_HAECO